MHFIIDKSHICFYFVVEPMWKEHRGEEAGGLLRFYAFFIFGFLFLSLFGAQALSWRSVTK